MSSQIKYSMELNSINSGQSIAHQVHDGAKCGICRSHLGRGTRIFKEGLSFGVVCEDCYKSNSPEDLELMANLFKAFGGYFGKLKDPDFSLYKVLESLTSNNSANGSILERNVKELHQALLHGVGPHQFRQGLRVMLD